MAQESMMNRTDRAKMAQKRLFVKRYSIQQYKANRIRPVSPQGGFVLYCSKQGICTANSKYNSPEAVVNL